ncbi:MAG: LysM peptidoglycan-binding domain-containing protein [Chloroflexi bacterium]|nr:MAG: LysM peptidoglycan-binding domain-containing protein [Chloroflexota bacterium]
MTDFLHDFAPANARRRRRRMRAIERRILLALAGALVLLVLLGNVVYGGSSGGTQTVTVAPGDTVWSIAASHYPDDADLRQRVDDIVVGRLLLVCESLEPRGRHLVNLVFAGEIRGGSLRAGLDGRLVDAAWEPVDGLATLEMYPPIGAEVLRCCREGLAGEVRVLGNVWRDQAGGGAAH